ncbi:MAG TPA: mechanosensitive ion channel, partial [bacterium]|nr:mechanosensitive ion channel [bacterium]
AVTRHVPENLQSMVRLVLKLLATLLVPLGFLAAYALVRAFTGIEDAWFLLIGRLIAIWAVGAGVLQLIRELFLHRMLPLPEQYAGTIHRVLRWIILYVLLTRVIFYAAEAFQLNPEYLAMLKVILTLTIVLASLLLIARKKEILSLLPDLPYRVYNIFRNALTRLYTPAMIGTFITGVLWSFGYRDLCRFIWIKTWAVAAVIVAVGLGYHGLNTLLMRRRIKITDDQEAARYFYDGLHSILVFSTTVILAYAVLSLLGFYDPLKRLISFPIMYAGEIPISMWSFVRAALIIWIFSLVSRIIRGYLDYKVFPALGVEEGLAYSINTFIGYLLIISGALFAMYTIGLDLRVLMVFAGAIGIGIGFGLQNMAANIISGFTLIFGQKIRKGDWIQAGDTLGYVKEVSMRVTRVVTRDSIEYLIPNSFLTSNTIVNYTLTDPLIRIHIPVGVSYT